jgi:hypothetical protein
LILLTQFPGVDKAQKLRIKRAREAYRADGETPEVGPLVVAGLGDLDEDKNPGLAAELTKYVRWLLTRDQSKTVARALELDSPGSIARAQLAQFLTPMIRARRFELWKMRSAPFPASTLGVSEALEQMEAWLKDSELVPGLPTVAFHGPDTAHLRSIPNTTRGIKFSQVIRSLVLTTHGESWLPLVDRQEAAVGLGWLKQHDAVLWFACGVHPRLPVAEAQVSEKSISNHGTNRPPIGSRISGWNRAHNHNIRGITITVKDPESVTPEMVMELYRAARNVGRFEVDGAPLQRNTEVLRVIELDLILDELECQVARGGVISRDAWQQWKWRPGPTELLKTWQARAEEFGCSSDDITSRQGMANFLKKVSFEEYRDSVRSALSFIS